MRTYVCLRMFGEKFVIKIIQNGFFSKLLECVGEQCVRSLDEVIDKLDGSGQPESLSNKRLNVLNSLRDLMVAAILFLTPQKREIQQLHLVFNRRVLADVFKCLAEHGDEKVDEHDDKHDGSKREKEP